MLKQDRDGGGYLEDDAEAPARNEGRSWVTVESRSAPAVAPRPRAELFEPRTEQGKAPPKRRARRSLLTLAILAGLGGASYYGHYWWTVGRFLVSTDDAYVRADMSVIAAKVPGYIAAVPVTDNDTVKAGAVLAQIDARDYENAVQAAKDKLATQDATIARLQEQAKAQAAVIAQAKAQILSAKANQTRAEADFERARTLAAKEFSSLKTLDQARADRDQALASVQSAQAAEASAEANLAVIEAQVKEAGRTRAELQTALEKAQLDLSYATIRAPFAGVVGNKAVEPGQYVQPGTRLLSLVPLDTVYIEANYKETQLGGIRPGQKVDVVVDAADGRGFQGTVESIAPASGSQFSLLPPENATGNFTKIVQRVPVRIRVSGDAVRSGVLRPGLSVTTYVDTKDARTAAQASARQAAVNTEGR